jgi:hypothetical protein
MMSHIFRAIETSYGSFEHPNWSFVSRKSKSGLYDALVNKLDELGLVQETTDLNDDCSRCLSVTSEAESLVVRLSLVGRFACVHDSNGRFFTAPDLPNSAIGAKLLQLLKSNEVELIGEMALQTKIKFGGQMRTLYELLFSTDELVA